MYFLSNVALFKKSDNSRSQDNLNKLKGGALIGGSAAVGTSAVRSGVPRLLGARLEQHGTSKKAAANIIKEGYLDPTRGGSLEGVTASMKLPKEFLERSKGHTFISGKNSDHVFWHERNPLSSLGDVITRKIQVLGYRGSKAGALTDKDIEDGSKFVTSKISNLTKPIKARMDALTPEKYMEQLKKQVESGDEFSKYEYERYLKNPEVLKKDLKKTKKQMQDIFRTIDDMGKRGYKDPTRVKSIKKTQKKIKELMKEFEGKIKANALETNKKISGGSVSGSATDIFGKTRKSNAVAHRVNLRELLSDVADAGDKKAARLLKLRESLDMQLSAQKTAKGIGLAAGWTGKLLKSPILGAAGVGKTLYIPGTDEFFNDTNRFKYDMDDPFGNPLKYKKSFASEKGGFGGNALKTKEKLRAFGNRFSATKYLLEKEGNGNLFKGAAKLIKANPKRSLAGAAILGIGGAGSYLLGKKGVDLIKGSANSSKASQRQEKVKGYVRKGKIVNSFTRLNPFYGKQRKQK